MVNLNDDYENWNCVDYLLCGDNYMIYCCFEFVIKIVLLVGGVLVSYIMENL